MELSDLKSVWKKASEQDILNHGISTEDLRKSITKRSNTVISQVQRTMKFKMIMFILIGSLNLILSPIYFLNNQELLFGLSGGIEMGIFMVIISLMLVAMGIHIVYSYKQITINQEPSPSLKTYLAKVVKILDRIMNVAVYSDVLTSPMIFAWIVYLFLSQKTTLSESWYFLILPLTAIIAAALTYVKGKFVQHRKFGRHRDKLVSYLSELEEISE